MQPLMKKEQFPLIKFDTVARENRNKSMEAGRLIHEDVDMVYIKQVGEKDESERVATEWLEQLRVQSIGFQGQEIRTTKEWYEFAKSRYDNFKAGKANIPDGYLVKEWPILSPSQVRNLHAMDTFTVEQIAVWSENAVGMYGMGGRELRDKARLWLESGDKKAEQLAALQVENKALKDQLEKLAKAVEELQAESSEDKPHRGRARKEPEAA